MKFRKGGQSQLIWMQNNAYIWQDMWYKSTNYNISKTLALVQCMKINSQ